MKPILEIKNISKKFIIHHEKKQYLSLRDSISAAFKINRNDTKEIFWALKDISFNVYPGESIGIIGRNGAGKSTLLKILSKITPPSSGKIISRGRIASLLEVGTGFHPELTGKENIFLNGSILGMKRKEIQNKFDEIVDFSGVEKFLDTPLKHYSSGMQLRLAFAVAAFLEPEILLIDEVLAVGDSEFQRKCLGKMDQVSKSGRTILFVSHNLVALENLCTSGVFIKGGEIDYIGNVSTTISKYQYSIAKMQNVSLNERTDRIGNGHIIITNIELRDTDGKLIDSARSGQSIDLIFKYQSTQYYQSQIGLTMGITINTLSGLCIALHHNKLIGKQLNSISQEGTFTIRIHELPLTENIYSITYSLMEGTEYFDRLENAIQLKIIGGIIYNFKNLPSESHGHLLLNAEWFNN
jgi:lipopolysaccharide transport system ATP-binding protein